MWSPGARSSVLRAHQAQVAGLCPPRPHPCPEPAALPPKHKTLPTTWVGEGKPAFLCEIK